MSEVTLSPFELAVQKRQKQEEEKESAKSGQFFGDFEQAEVVGLVDKKEIVGRVIGNPLEIRMKPSDPKLILQSSIVKEDKKGYIKVNWPIIEKGGKYVPDPAWILTRFYDKVNEGKWETYADGHTNERGKTGEYKKYHKETEIFKQVEGNAKEGERYPKSFYPSKRVVLNWLDRMDSWCKDNKHMKLLSAKKSPFDITKDDGTKSTIYFTDTGIPLSVYDAIIEHCRAVLTLDIDLVVIKKASDKKYDIWDITDSKYISPSSVEIGSQEPLTTEELNYELYDLDKMYKITSYRKLDKHMKSRFALCDAELGTNFVEELKALVQKEKDEVLYWIDKTNNTYGVSSIPEFVKEGSQEIVSQADFTAFRIVADSDKGSQESAPVAESTPEPEVSEPESLSEEKAEPVSEEKAEKAEEAPVQSRRPAPEVKSEAVVSNNFEDHFPSWNSLSSEEKEVMKNAIDGWEEHVPIYKEGGHPLCSDVNCFFKDSKIATSVPSEVLRCPVCGVTFK